MIFQNCFRGTHVTVRENAVVFYVPYALFAFVRYLYDYMCIIGVHSCIVVCQNLWSMIGPSSMSKLTQIWEGTLEVGSSLRLAVRIKPTPMTGSKKNHLGWAAHLVWSKNVECLSIPLFSKPWRCFLIKFTYKNGVANHQTPSSADSTPPWSMSQNPLFVDDVFFPNNVFWIFQSVPLPIFLGGFLWSLHSIGSLRSLI